MKTLATIAALMLLSSTAIAGNSAPNVYPKEHATGAPGACHAATVGDDARLAWGSLSVANTSTAAAKVACSRDADLSTNGTARFGGVLSNKQASNRVMTCTADISSGGSGPKSVPRSVIVGPNTSERIEWNAADMGQRVLLGGQIGFTCVLLPGASLSWIWMVPGA